MLVFEQTGDASHFELAMKVCMALFRAGIPSSQIEGDRVQKTNKRPDIAVGVIEVTKPELVIEVKSRREVSGDRERIDALNQVLGYADKSFRPHAVPIVATTLPEGTHHLTRFYRTDELRSQIFNGSYSTISASCLPVRWWPDVTTLGNLAQETALRVFVDDFTNPASWPIQYLDDIALLTLSVAGQGLHSIPFSRSSRLINQIVSVVQRSHLQPFKKHKILAEAHFALADLLIDHGPWHLATMQAARASTLFERIKDADGQRRAQRVRACSLLSSGNLDRVFRITTSTTDNSHTNACVLSPLTHALSQIAIVAKRPFDTKYTVRGAVSTLCRERSLATEELGPLVGIHLAGYQAMAAVVMGNYHEALNIFSMLLDRAPFLPPDIYHVWAMEYEGICHIFLGDDERGLEILQDAMQICTCKGITRRRFHLEKIIKAVRTRQFSHASFCRWFNRGMI